MGTWQELAGYLTTSDNWWGANGIARRTWDHLRLSAVSLGASVVVGIPPALWLGHIRRGGPIATALVNLGRAVPSLAIVALALPFSLRYGFGLGFWPTFAALFVLGLPPVFTNTYAGTVAVDPASVDAARGMGMRGGQVLWRVEVPNALPLILAGVRVSALQIVATATLGAFVGYGGLGAFINEGFRQHDDGKLLTGAVLVAALALVTELLFEAVHRTATPWLRRKAIT